MVAVEIDIRADTPSVFRFTAQKRIPGRDFRDFASSRDWGHESLSRYSLELLPPIRTYTDLRVYLLVDGAASRPTRIIIGFAQNGQPLGVPIVCDGKIGNNGELEFVTAEATLITNEGTLI